MFNKVLYLGFSLLLLNCGETKETTIKKPTTTNTSNQNNSASNMLGKVKNVRDYGAIGDGIADDTAAIQKALDDGDGTVILLKKHSITRSLVNNNSNTITFQGIGKAEILSPDNAFYKIKNNASLKISEVNVSPPFIELIGTKTYETLEITNCIIHTDLDHVPRTKNYALKASGSATIQHIVFSENTVANTTVIYANKDTKAHTLTFKGNTITNFKSFVMAMQNCNAMFVEGNIISGALSGTKSVRVMLRTGLNETHFKNNTIENINTDVMTSVLYSSSGTLYCKNNVFKNIRGNGNSYVISDKSSSKEKWYIEDNIFDQDGVENQLLKGLIKGGNNEVIIKENTFKNNKMKAIQLGTTKPEHVNSEPAVIANNQFIDSENPVCISLTFATGPVIIKDNTVKGIKNIILKKANNDASCRFISINNTKELYTIGPVEILNNTVENVDQNASLLWLNSKNGGGISNISIANNTMNSGKQLIKYRNKETKPSITYKDNKMPSRMQLENITNNNAIKN